MIDAKKKEVRRQVFHIFFGLVLIYLIMENLLGAREIFWLLILSCVLSVLSFKIRIPLVNWFLKNMERARDFRRFPGKGFIFFLVGVLLALKLFNRNIALAAIAIMVLGDSFSNLIGSSVKKSKYNISKDKNIEGIIGGIIIGGVGASFFVNPLYAFIASFFAMLIEGVGLKLGGNSIDDNIIIPLVAGTIIYLFETGFQVFII